VNLTVVGFHNMYPGIHATKRADQPAVIMANSGATVTYAEYEAISNRLAHLLRAEGLQRGDHYAIFMENHPWYLPVCCAGERAGLYYTPTNSHLNVDELGYIFENSQSQVVVTSAHLLDVALSALPLAPNVKLCLVADGAGPYENIGSTRVLPLAEALASFPATPIADESAGFQMLYSSGTTGRPKGILKNLPKAPVDKAGSEFLMNIWLYREGQIYLSPAPLYHSAPQAAAGLTIRKGGTVIVMEKFDPEQFLQLIEKHRVTHIQMVPTMFSRLLKLPDEVRTKYDHSSLEMVVHAAAPCPVPVKEKMLAWWGPIIREYYSATEGLGFTLCDATEWMAHKGTVGRCVLGEMHILGDDFNECEVGQPGTVWFKSPIHYEYFGDPDKTKDSTSPDGRLSTVGDVGYVDKDGYLFLTDRATFMIISGGVNIYPQETENLFITHPKVADAAVFGVPNIDLGEEMKAVIQLMPGIEPSDALVEELMEFCRQHLSLQKCPRSIDFEAELPRTPTGKLFKKPLRERYWANHGGSRIV
jgi:long-chain acyl-CoA synthetase